MSYGEAEREVIDAGLSLAEALMAELGIPLRENLRHEISAASRLRPHWSGILSAGMLRDAEPRPTPLHEDDGALDFWNGLRRG